MADTDPNPKDGGPTMNDHDEYRIDEAYANPMPESLMTEGDQHDEASATSQALYRRGYEAGRADARGELDRDTLYRIIDHVIAGACDGHSQGGSRHE